LHTRKKYWSQRAKIKHIKNTDINTTYFHRIASGKRNLKIIKQIQSAEGTTIVGEENIRNETKKDFESRFKAGEINNNLLTNQLQVINREISDEDNEMLTANLSNSEIKNAIFNIGDDKSPGPEGMTVEFYKKYWDIVGPAVIKAIKSFFHNGKILKQINHTFITLIPKVDNHRQPITTDQLVYALPSIKQFLRFLRNVSKKC